MNSDVIWSQTAKKHVKIMNNHFLTSIHLWQAIWCVQFNFESPQ